MADSNPIKPFVKGQSWQNSGAQLQQMRGVSNTTRTIRGDGLVMVNQTGAGTTITLNVEALRLALRTQPRVHNWYEIITNSGSGAYVVRRQYWDSSGTALVDADAAQAEYSVTAYDVLERDSGTPGAMVDGYWEYSGGEQRMLITVGSQGGTTSAPTIGPSTASEDEADTDTWDRASQTTSQHGVKIYRYRYAYAYGGDEVLHGFKRLETYDDIGLLVDIGAETEFTIDTPDGCE